MEYHEMMKRIEEIRAHGNHIFRVRFIKRSTKEIRVMTCRLHVKKGVKGVQPNRRERDLNNRLMTVYEMAGDKSGFKCIPIEGILDISPAKELK